MFIRRDIMLKHLSCCKVAKEASQHNIQDNISTTTQAYTQSQSNSQSDHNHSHSHNQTIVNNHYNIKYTADLSSRNMLEQIIFFLKDDYIKKGEEGFCEFLLEKVFTDPKDVTKLAIACTNYNQQKFVYAMKDDSNQTPFIQEDTKLTQLDEKHLSKYDKYIKEVLIKHSDKLVNCKGKTTKETKQNVQAFLDTVLNRKKLPPLMARKIRSKREGIVTKEKEVSSEQDALDELWAELKKDQALLETNQPIKSTTHATLDEDLGRSSFYTNTIQQNTLSSETDEQEEKEETIQDKWYQESLEEQRQFELKAKEKARLRKQKEEEKERKHIEALENKEKIRRANEIAKQQALQKEVEKKKKKLYESITGRPKNSSIGVLETITE
jgi:hypothetical protein